MEDQLRMALEELLTKWRKRVVSSRAELEAVYNHCADDLAAALASRTEAKMSQPENESLREALAFLADLSNATTYRSHDLGYEDSISIHWREDAADLHKKLASRAPGNEIRAEVIAELYKRHGNVLGARLIDELGDLAVALAKGAD